MNVSSLTSDLVWLLSRRQHSFNMASKRKPLEEKGILPPGASVRDVGLHMASLFPLQGPEWEGVPLLSILQPPDYDSDEREVEWLDEHGTIQVSRIHDTERKKVQIVSKTFPAQKWAAAKERVNRIVAHLIATLSRKRREVVVLDHYQLRTSTLLSQLPGPRRKPLLTPQQIHVPNPDPNFLHHVSAPAARRVTLTQETLYEWINRQDTEDEDLVAAFDVLADYCCHWEGHATCHPSLDLHTMFRKTLLAKKNGVLWLTFSTRGTTGDAVKAQVHRWLEAEMVAFDYALTLAYSQSYGHVVTMVYVTGREHYPAGPEGFAYLSTL